MTSKVGVEIDANPIIKEAKSGIGFYIVGLIVALQKYKPDYLNLSIFFFNNLGKKNTPKEVNDITTYSQKIIPGKLLSLVRKTGWQIPFEFFYGFRQKTIKIYTNYVSLPSVFRAKYGLVIYDLCYLDSPEYIQEKNLNFLNKYCAPSIKNADFIITISSFTKERISYHFPEVTNRIVVTPIPPLSKEPANVVLTKRLEDLGVINSKYILYLGTVEPRKNIINLLKAYECLPQNIRATHSLVIAGGKGWKDEEILLKISELKTNGFNVIQTGYISDDEKAALYSNAGIFVLPSHYEGFGMPILEAAQYNIPVAVSDIDVFHEVASDSALYFDKDDPNDIANKINELIMNENLALTLIEKGRANLKRFSWQKNADVVYEAIEKVLPNRVQ